MVQEELVEILATEHGISLAAARGIVRTILTTITDTVAKGDKVSFAGFGVFEPVYTAARKGHNISTQTPIQIKAKFRPRFTPGRNFKQIVGASAALQEAPAEQ